MSNNSRLLEEWIKASKDIGFEIESSFTLVLKCGHVIHADFLVYGPCQHNGILILPSYHLIAKYVNEVIEMNYGFSILSEPKDNVIYDSNSFIETIKDWGFNIEK